MTKKLKKLQQELVSLYSEVKDMSINNISNKFRLPYAEAEDLYQHSFIKAYSKLDTFKGGSSLKTWFYRIIQNAAIDFIRRPWVKADKNAFPMDAECYAYIKELQDDCNNPAQILQAQDNINNLKIKIKATLDKLSPAHKTVIDLVYSDGGSYEKAAKTMKCSMGTIMSRVFYAKRNFIKIYSNNELKSAPKYK